MRSSIDKHVYDLAVSAFPPEHDTAGFQSPTNLIDLLSRANAGHRRQFIVIEARTVSKRGNDTFSVSHSFSASDAPSHPRTWSRTARPRDCCSTSSKLGRALENSIGRASCLKEDRAGFDGSCSVARSHCVRSIPSDCLAQDRLPHPNREMACYRCKH